MSLGFKNDISVRGSGGESTVTEKHCHALSIELLRTVMKNASMAFTEKSTKTKSVETTHQPLCNKLLHQIV